MDFTHYTDRSVRLAVDLVNTLNPVSGRDDLADPEDLEDFLAEYDGAHEGGHELAEHDLAEVRLLRERLRRIFEAPDEERAAALLNELLLQVEAVPRLSVHAGSQPHLHFEPLGAAPARWLGATTAMGLATVLCDWGKERLGVCDSSTCRDVYVDTSRNRSRRYCSESCTSRENVAAFRRRRREQGS